ncbi:MAG: radical SAM protein [Planctomycetota bacterium]|nr:MAG: radical SAM protein [Planctomycetota bacterium]
MPKLSPSKRKGKVKTTKTILYITEIFYSIQGESNDAGYPCVFVRLSGCDLRCHWCDTEYSFRRGKKMELEEILSEIQRYPVRRVEITGGEPLLQKGVYPLLKALIKKGYRTLLETGGHRDIADVPRGVIKVLDIKCPDSGMAERMHWQNLAYLSEKDVIKFVIASRKDYEYAKKIIQEYSLNTEQVHLSPVVASLSPHRLAKWMLEDALEVRLQPQLHKWLEVP